MFKRNLREKFWGVVRFFLEKVGSREYVYLYLVEGFGFMVVFRYYIVFCSFRGRSLSFFYYGVLKTVLNCCYIFKVIELVIYERKN